MIRQNTDSRCSTQTAILGLSLVCLALLSNTAASQPPTVPAFPGAEGYGAMTSGGRGGRVIEVTNLEAAGPGSLRAALEAQGPRIVVFKVSGTIDADLNFNQDHITVAGQTAPGDGITIKGQLHINASDVVVRYLRVRAEGRDDAVSSRYKKNIILDHVSASWSKDEVMSLYHGENVTIQWCMATEACGGSHRFGGIWGNNHGTYHHNLIAHNISRNPRFASGSGNNDFRNNVIYNWQHQSDYGGEAQQPIKATSAHKLNETFSSFSVNMVANYFKPGPGTHPDSKNRICSPWSRNGVEDYGDWYLADNYMAGNPEVTADNWKGVFPKSEAVDVDLDAIPGLRLMAPSESLPIPQETAQEAYEAVLRHVGCSLPARDAIDDRIIEEVRSGTATKGDQGFIETPSDAGGWPDLQSQPAPADDDHDGMPNVWEDKAGLDLSDASDAAQDKDNDGYTNVEEYINGTDPGVFIDYTNQENNLNTLH
ncbi:pectate lyase family protein [Aureliella helgolandensis]|uniref:Pectate lyase n=1 Tax=Aureliella helgolandensis TaxID=2527968 RepID=A0A518G9H5_9BACT|nr:pectate lyase [Aureliella helgolandensis]QDV25220.1 hypothetical protein Q31a_35430 [Aureliella helgolandensis]